MKPSQGMRFHSVLNVQVGGVSGVANAVFTVPPGCVFRGYYGGNTSVAAMGEFTLLYGANIYGYPSAVNARSVMSGPVELPAGNYIARNSTGSAVNSSFVIGVLWKVA